MDCIGANNRTVVNNDFQRVQKKAIITYCPVIFMVWIKKPTKSLLEQSVSQTAFELGTSHVQVSLNQLSHYPCMQVKVISSLCTPRRY